MPEYEDPELEQSAELSEQATESFEEAVHSRETADNFVRSTVILAGVLFLIAVGQRFDVKGVRIGVLAVAGAFLVTAALVLLTGLLKPLARLIAAIPAAIANAMLAGMLLTLCLAPVTALATTPLAVVDAPHSLALTAKLWVVLIQIDELSPTATA
jgi:hypothetical protein